MALNFLNNGYFAGKVGIGTESPGEKLSVYDSSSSTGYVASFGNSSNLELLIGTTTGAYLNIQGSTISSGAPYNITLQNDGGNVGIGTTAPTSKLHIEGSSDGTGAGVDAMLHVKQTGSWNANEPWALYVDGYSYLNGFRINANDGIRGLFKTQSGGSLGFATAGADPITFTQSNTVERMRIHSNGNVGIGTTSPSSKLHIASATTSTTLTIESMVSPSLMTSGIDLIRYGVAKGSRIESLRNASAGGVGLNFLTTADNAAEISGTLVSKMVILRSGNVGIGTTSPAYKLDVAGTGNFTGLVSGITPVAAANFVTKAYVDGSGGGTGPFLPLAGGTLSGNLKLNDDVQLNIGSSGSDLRLVHSSNNSYIQNFVGDLQISNYADDKDILFRCDDGAGGLATYLFLDGSNKRIQFNTDFITGDNNKITFGNSGDLQIYHDGSNSYIQDTSGTGDLRVDTSTFRLRSANGGETMIRAFEDGAVILSHNNFDKLTTTSTGVTVTGNVLASGYLAGQASQYNPTGGGTTLATLTGSGASRTNLVISNQTNDAAASTALVLATYGHDYFIKGSSSLGGSQLTLGFNTSNFLTLTSSAATFAGTVTSPTFIGDLNGTINTVTTAVTKANATNDTTVATTAFVQNLIGTIPAGLVFQGTWNAATNTPTLTSGSGTTGHFYIVSTSGNTNLDGVTDWKVGDWAVFIEQGASDQWEKIDNSSVLDGIGTGQSVTKWDGSGTSNTLTDGPITFSTNNSTFAGNVTISNASPALNLTDTDNASNIAFSSVGGALVVNSPSDQVYQIGGTEKFRIASTVATFASSVSATNSTGAQLQVSGWSNSNGANNANGTIYLGNTDAYRAVIDYDAASLGSLIISNTWNNDDGDIIFKTKTASTSVIPLTLKGSGKVGIGTTSPGAKLDVKKGSEGLYFAAGGDTGNARSLQFTSSANGGSNGAMHTIDAISGNGLIAFATAGVERIRITSTGLGVKTTSVTAALNVLDGTSTAVKATRIGNDTTSIYRYATLADAVLEWTCGSYHNAEVVITASQTNSGTYNNLYIRGIWSNNHTSHHWDELEHVGSLTGTTFTITNGQNGSTTNSGRLTLDVNYVSGSFATLNIRVTDFYGSHSYTIT